MMYVPASEIKFTFNKSEAYAVGSFITAKFCNKYIESNDSHKINI